MIARLFLGFVVIFSLLLAVTGFLTPIDATTFAANFSGIISQQSHECINRLPYDR